MRLEYFDCISFSVIDPMHNLFQGTAKYMFKTIWADKLSKEDLKIIQSTVDAITVPTSLGRIPRKIASSFSSFTSDQWMNWTLYFSAIALKDVLGKQDYSCWLHFVEACRSLCKPSLSIRDIRHGHEKLMLFCRTFEKLYGSNAVTPNMHLHTHLIECILDYGPIHSFWLFSFERMNGILGSFNTNQRSPEIQFMRNIVKGHAILNMPEPQDLSSLFAESLAFRKTTASKVKNTEVVIRLQNLSAGEVKRGIEWIQDADINYIGTMHDGSLTEHLLRFLQDATKCFIDVSDFQISGNCQKYFSMEMCGERYGSSSSRLQRSSIVLASWCGPEGEINTTGSDIRPGIIRYFVTFFIKIRERFVPVHFAFVHWWQRVPYHFSPLVSLWCRNIFEPEGPACFLPVQRIVSKAVCAPVKVKNENVVAVIPHIRQLYH